MTNPIDDVYHLLNIINEGYTSPLNARYNDLIVEGDLTVNGETTVLNTTTVELEDPIIIINKTGTGSSLEKSGLEVERGALTNQRLIFDESDDKWKVGEDGSEKILSTLSSALTLGSIVYANSTGELAQSNANVFYDSTNVRFGLGTNTPISKLHLAYVGSGSSSGINDIVSSTNIPPMSIVMQDTRNYGSASQEYNRGIHLIFNSDQENRFSGSGTLQRNLSAISMAYHPFGSYVTSEQGATNIMFYTTGPNSGNTSPEFSEKMRIQYNGTVGIGTTAPSSSAILDITSTTKGLLLPRTTTSSITTPVAGLTIYDTSLNNMTLYNGTSWLPIPKVNFFNVYYSNVSVENSTITTVTAGSSYFRVGLTSTLFKGDVNLFNINGNYMSCKYVGVTATKNSQHNINISYLSDTTCITTWIVYKNATFTLEKITGGTILFDSRIRHSVDNNHQTNVSLSFMDIPSNNDTYHVGILHSHGNNVIFTPSTFNWMINSY
jgi:hypothetical protein